jgi:hypothetical protein
MGVPRFIGFMSRPKNRRVNLRKDVNAQAWISLNGGFAMRPCTVVDMSETGVRLAVAGPQTVPSAFTLRMSRNNGSTGKAVRIKWRQGSEIGAIFV